MEALALLPNPLLQEYVSASVAVTLIEETVQLKTVVPVLLVIPGVMVHVVASGTSIRFVVYGRYPLTPSRLFLTV